MKRVTRRGARTYDIKNSSEVLITTVRAFSHPLTSEYRGREIGQGEIKNTKIFFVPWNLGDIVAQGDYVWEVDGSASWFITGYKTFDDHTEIVGLVPETVVVPETAANTVSEWAFRDSGGLGDDEQGLNFLDDINTVGWSADVPSQVSSSLGSAVFYGENAEHLEITDGNQSGLDITGDLTIAFRVKMTDAPTSTNGLVGKGDSTGAGDTAYYIYTDTSNKIKFELTPDGSSQSQAVGATSLSTNTWYSVCCVYDSTDQRIYINGSLDSNGSNNPKTYSGGIHNSAKKFVIGSRGDDTQYAYAKIAHVFIFDEAKSSAQVSSWHSNDTWS